MNILSPYPINFEQGEERKEEGEGREWKKERGEKGRRRGERMEEGEGREWKERGEKGGRNRGESFKTKYKSPFRLHMTSDLSLWSPVRQSAA